jgi:2-(1,2-epoxy-1,2-dihydrophenyl)acetyl-CoA isomerase
MATTANDSRQHNDPTALLVQRLYDALAAVDTVALDEILHPDFRGVLAAGMPFGVGGEHRGADAMRRNGWGAIGRHFVARAEPDRFLPPDSERRRHSFRRRRFSSERHWTPCSSTVPTPQRAVRRKNSSSSGFGRVCRC